MRRATGTWHVPNWRTPRSSTILRTRLTLRARAKFRRFSYSSVPICRRCQVLACDEGLNRCAHECFTLNFKHMKILSSRNQFERDLAALRLVLIGFSALLLAGCTLISGSKIVPTVGSDRATVSEATDRLAGKIPSIKYAFNGRLLKIYRVAFDGTLNDAARVPSDERETIVAHIAKIIKADQYYPGPGMQDPHSINVADAAVGYSSARTAQQAETAFLAQAAQWVKDDPTVEIRVFVTGFSRGAATARHFMNIVTRDWRGCSGCSASNSPEFFAILYDTVATFQMESLKLSLPPSLNFLIHVMAADEPRVDFKPLVDVEYQRGWPEAAGTNEVYESQRLHLMVLPGSHSDIGAAYPEGVGDVYRDMTEMWLHELGLIKQNCWESFDDPYVAGKHDSRGWLDVLTFTASPNSSRSIPRQAYVERAQALDEANRQTIELRLHYLEEASAFHGEGTATNKIEKPALRMMLRRHGQNLALLELDSPGADRNSFKYEVVKGVRQISFHYLPPVEDFGTKVVLNDDIWSRFPEGTPVVLAYTVLKTPQGRIYVSADVNGVSMGAEQWNDGPSKVISDVRNECARDADGTLVSPFQTITFSPNATAAQ
jgi:hypothetical protein